MKVLFFCPLWGSEGLAFEAFAAKVKESGYDGVEMVLPADTNQKARVLDVLKGAGLQLIGHHSETIDTDIQSHKINYEKRLRNLAEAKPLLINTQTGKDYFPFERNCELIDLAKKISTETGIPIYHETHRSRFAFAAHITRQYLEHLEDLRIALDISHWCCVAESFLDDQAEAVSLALSRAGHVHARIGYQEGPQVPDLRMDRWKEAVERHLLWWDQIIERVRDEGRSFFTITAEFGPFPYMQMHPETDRPVTDQWDVNVYMKELLNERYNG